MYIKRDTFSFIALSAYLKQQLYSFGRQHIVIILNGKAEDMQCWHLNVHAQGPRATWHKSSAIDFTHLTNIPKEISGNIGIYFFFLSGPEGGDADWVYMVYMCVCACLSDNWTWTRTRKSPQERRVIFSHGRFCMTLLRHKRIFEQTVYCTLS